MFSHGNAHLITDLITAKEVNCSPSCLEECLLALLCPGSGLVSELAVEVEVVFTLLIRNVPFH